MRLIGFVMLLGLLVGPVLAQDTGSGDGSGAATTAELPSDEEVSQRALTLFRELMSPYCPGATLRDCGSGQAEVLRNRIRGWIRAGRSDKEITDELVEEFGETILSKPRFKGFGAVAYIAPIAALLIGLGALLAYLKGQRSKTAPVAVAEGAVRPSKASDDASLRRRLDEELKVHSGK